MTTNLIEERKLSSVTRESMISTSNNIAKIFGNYLNVDETRDEIVEENLQEDDVEIHSNITGVAKQDIEKNRLSQNSSDEDNDIGVHTKTKSLQTPQFNILKNSHDFECLSKFQQKENENFSKEDSLFAPQQEYTISNQIKEFSDEMSNLNIDKISKSLNEELVENLDKDFTIKNKNKKMSFDSSGTGMNVKSV